MSEKTKRNFGIWMDTHHATIVGLNPEGSEFIVLGHAENPGPGSNSNENASNNLEITLRHKYFREIGKYLENADAVHVTGPGTVQEEFVHHLAETPQFKKATVTDTTSKPLSDEALISLISSHFA